ncbi:MAG: hypothetical protein ACJAZA_000980, partial [Shewanella psychromarinicola]
QTHNPNDLSKWAAKFAYFRVNFSISYDKAVTRLFYQQIKDYPHILLANINGDRYSSPRFEADR